mgnify:CR=1 FL=1
MEQVNFSNDEELIPESVEALIEEEVRKTVDPIRGEDPETAEFNEELLRDYKKFQYLFLDWFNKTEQPGKVLYAGSGFDTLPKVVFGEDKVVHTSLEQYRGDTENYFPQLGNGLKVIADNIKLPFHESAFDTVLFFGLSEESVQNRLPESIRTLKVGGFVVCDSTMLNETDISPFLPDFEKIEVPEQLQSEGISEAKFQVFKKLPE